MSWNLATISAFYMAERHNPFEYARMETLDPVCRLLTAYNAAVAAYESARHEHQGLGSGVGVGAISSDATRSGVLEGLMSAALVRRDALLIGLSSACGSLGSAEEPTIRYLQRRPGEQALIAVLEGVAVSCGV